jgi:hypothetical protein
LEGAAKEEEMHRLKIAKDERVSDADHSDFNRYCLIRTMRTSLPFRAGIYAFFSAQTGVFTLFKIGLVTCHASVGLGLGLVRVLLIRPCEVWFGLDAGGGASD